MSGPIDFTAPAYYLRLCCAARAFIKQLLIKKRLNRPLHNAPPVSAPQMECLSLEVKFSTSLTRRTL